MTVGYNVVQPSGKVRKLRVDSAENRQQVANELLSTWEDYCQRNWISFGNSDQFSPESKVKLFQDGLAYFLMMGGTKDIVTDYKDIMNGKREIPISSCPSSIEDLVYSSNASGVAQDVDENSRFQLMVDRLDERGPKLKKKKIKTKKKTRFDKINELKERYGPCGFSFATVLTDNTFSFGGNRYQINSDQYNAKQTDVGELYDMDKIICVTTEEGKTMFFDMDIEKVEQISMFDQDGQLVDFYSDKDKKELSCDQ